MDALIIIMVALVVCFFLSLLHTLHPLDSFRSEFFKYLGGSRQSCREAAFKCHSTARIRVLDDFRWINLECFKNSHHTNTTAHTQPNTHANTCRRRRRRRRVAKRRRTTTNCTPVSRSVLSIRAARMQFDSQKTHRFESVEGGALVLLLQLQLDEKNAGRRMIAGCWVDRRSTQRACVTQMLATILLLITVD